MMRQTPLCVLWIQQRTKCRKKKICPEALGTLNKVIKGGFSKEVPSDLKDKGAGPGRTRGMKSADGVTQGSIGPKSQQKLLPSWDWLPWVRCPPLVQSAVSRGHVASGRS